VKECRIKPGSLTVIPGWHRFADRLGPRVRPLAGPRTGADRVVLAALHADCGGIGTTSCRKPRSTRAPWCEALHASIPIRLGGSLAKNFPISRRRICRRRKTGFSCSSTL
jgi:hypothetical protein